MSREEFRAFVAKSRDLMHRRAAHSGAVLQTPQIRRKFRAKYSLELGDIFTQIVKLGYQSGLVKGRVAYQNSVKIEPALTARV